MANPTYRNCNRSADAGAYCSSFAAGIVAKAFNPFYGGRRKKLPPGQRTVPREPGPAVGSTSAQQRLFR